MQLEDMQYIIHTLYELLIEKDLEIKPSVAAVARTRKLLLNLSEDISGLDISPDGDGGIVVDWRLLKEHEDQHFYTEKMFRLVFDGKSKEQDYIYWEYKLPNIETIRDTDSHLSRGITIRKVNEMLMWLRSSEIEKLDIINN